MPPRRGKGLPPGMSGEMSLEYFVKTYVKRFKNRPNVLEVPFKELRADGWEYKDGKFILRAKDADES